MTNKDKENKKVNFMGTILRSVYESGDYKVYAVEIDSDEYPNIKKTKYGNAIISGELPECCQGAKYDITAFEELTKNGYGYHVINITRRKPNNADDMYFFLQEILTENQAKTLWEVYPDIVDRVMNNKLDDIDLNKLKGIKEYTFNCIKDKIIDNYCLSELVNEFQGYFSLNVLKKLHDTYTSVDMIKDKLKKEPYSCLCRLSGVGFQTADNLLLDLQRVSEEAKKKNEKPIFDFGYDLKTSKQRCLYCIIYLLEQNEKEGNTNMSLAVLKSQVDKLCPSCANLFVDILNEYTNIICYNKKTLIVSLKETYEKECLIAYNMIKALTINNKWENINYNKYRIINGFNLSDEQFSILQAVAENNIVLLIGSAGVGKSASTKAVIDMCIDNNKSFKLFAPTGKASKVLTDYTKHNATTIHRGLAYIPPFDWGYNEDNKLGSDIIIVDEFSMVDVSLMEHLIKAINFNTTKLLIVGDNAQLPSVGCGNLLHDFIQSNVFKTVMLTKVFRYGEGGLMKIATDVRNCTKYLKDIKDTLIYFGTNKDYAFINLPSDIIPSNAVALYKKLLSQGYNVEDIQVLIAQKIGECGTITINNQIQKVANPNFGGQNYMSFKDVTYYEGDIIIQTSNNYHAEIYYSNSEGCPFDENLKETFIANGETGKILEVNQTYMIINFDGVHVRYYRNDVVAINLGYAITIHKSQGSSAKVIILLTPKSHTYMLNSNLIYVGLTRMKEKCFHLGEVKTVNNAIMKKENLYRNTYMQDLLKTFNNNRLESKDKNI